MKTGGEVSIASDFPDLMNGRVLGVAGGGLCFFSEHGRTRLFFWSPGLLRL